MLVFKFPEYWPSFRFFSDTCFRQHCILRWSVWTTRILVILLYSFKWTYVSVLISVLLVFSPSFLFDSAPAHCLSASKGSRSVCRAVDLGGLPLFASVGFLKSLWWPEKVESRGPCWNGPWERTRGTAFAYMLSGPQERSSVHPNGSSVPKLSPPEWKRVILNVHSNLEIEAHTTYMRVALPFWCLCPDWLRGRWVVGAGGSGTWDTLLRAPGHDPIYFSILGSRARPSA